MDRLQRMQVFVRVVEHGSFTRAADALGISRASATAAVAKLEQRLHVRLLQRTTRRISVTEEGQSYYAHCVRILDDIAEVEDDLATARDEAKGRLRVSVPESFLGPIFFPAMTAFLQGHPNLELEVVLTDRAVNLVEEGIDCAIRGVEIPTDSSLVARTLADTRWLTCAAPSYLERNGWPRSPDDLDGHNCIRFISQSTGRARDWIFHVDGERRTVVPTGNLRLNSFGAVIKMTAAGMGVAQIPDLLACEEVLSGRLQPLFTDIAAHAPPLVLVYPGSRYLPARVRVFMDYFARAFPREGRWSEILAVTRALTDGPGTSTPPETRPPRAAA